MGKQEQSRFINTTTRSRGDIMAVVFYHNPYDKASRDKLNELISQGANIIIEKRTDSAQDAGWKLNGHISFLPSLILHDDDGSELTRAEILENITHDHVKWMHDQHSQWVANGRKPNPFPKPPWKAGS